MFSFAAEKVHPFDLLCEQHYCTLFILSGLFIVRRDISADAHDPLEDVKTLRRFRFVKSHYFWMPASEKSLNTLSSAVCCTRCFNVALAGTRVGREQVFLGRTWAFPWAALFCCHLQCIQDWSPIIFCFPITMLSTLRFTLNTLTKTQKHSQNRLPILMKIIITSGAQSVLPLGKG